MKKLIIIAAVLAALGWVGTQDVNDEQRRAQTYCEQVKQWKDSKGERGWPDFKMTFTDACTPQGDAK